MAVAAQEHMTPDAPDSARVPQRQRVVWPKPSQLRQSAPILRLLAEIWAIPQVTKLGFVHLSRRSSGERQGIGEAVKEGAWDFDDLVGRW